MFCLGGWRVEISEKSNSEIKNKSLEKVVQAENSFVINIIFLVIQIQIKTREIVGFPF